jgi:hypothetical protein
MNGKISKWEKEVHIGLLWLRFAKDFLYIITIASVENINKTNRGIDGNSGTITSE